MSFIFEALKRAEEDRRRGDAPPLNAVLHGGHGPQRRRWPWLVVAVGLAANAAVLGGWLWARRSGPPGEKVPGPVAESASPRTVAEVERPVTAPPRIVSGDLVLHPELPGVERADEPSGRPSTAVELTPQVPSVAPDPTAARDVPAPSRAPVHAAVEPAKPMGRPDPVPLEDLPPGVRTRLARIRVDGHVYRDDPTKSFVFIDNHVYHEGDTVGADGPRIETITPTGLVADYGGGRVILTASGQ